MRPGAGPEPAVLAAGSDRPLAETGGLFAAQSDHGIDPRGPSCRNQTRYKRHRDQKQGNTAHDQGLKICQAV